MNDSALLAVIACVIGVVLVVKTAATAFREYLNHIFRMENPQEWTLTQTTTEYQDDDDDDDENNDTAA